MSINFIPNDPSAASSAPPKRSQPKHANRGSTRSDFALSNQSSEGEYETGTPEFLFWQCREAALLAIDAWESVAGPHTRWQGKRKKIPLQQDAGQDMNAYYDRAGVSFFHDNAGGRAFLTGQSTDVVSHEVGHGLLDSIRPDLWDVTYLEVGAFHESFGDCMALLTALNDKTTRQKLLAVTTTLRRKNFVETLMEDLATGLRLDDPTQNAADPRHAYNKHQYQLPSSLPNDGPPGALINEEHSFGMIFTGCFWDLIAKLFADASAKTEAALLKAATTAGTILIEGAKNAVVSPRFLQAVGRAMVLADGSLNGSANRDHIRDAFLGHDVQLGANAILAPTMALAGGIKAGKLDAKSRKDLLTRLRAARGARLEVSRTAIADTPALTALHVREVPLGSLDRRLQGVVALGHEPVMLTRSGTRAAVMGALPNDTNTEHEVQSYVESLLEHDAIVFDGSTRTRAAAAKPRPERHHATHAIEKLDGKKVLRRIRFRC